MARNYVFTINYALKAKHFETDEEGFAVDDFGMPPVEEWKDVRYVCYQEEIGEEGTHHIQGYVQFKQPKRITQLKKYPGLERAHIEAQRGTNQEAKDYALKDDETTVKDTKFEWGYFNPGQGARVDIYKLRDMVKEGKGLKAIYDNDETLLPALQYSRGLQTMIGTYNRDLRRNFKTFVDVFVGETGRGKTRRAAEENPNYYMKPHSKWWDNYQHEEVVLFDDFYGWYPYNQLLILLDRYDCPVEYKGGYFQIAPKKVVITSNHHINDWYDRDKIKDIHPLIRRVDRYVWFHPDGSVRTYEGEHWYQDFCGDQLLRPNQNDDS